MRRDLDHSALRISISRRPTPVALCFERKSLRGIAKFLSEDADDELTDLLAAWDAEREK